MEYLNGAEEWIKKTVVVLRFATQEEHIGGATRTRTSAHPTFDINWKCTHSLIRTYNANTHHDWLPTDLTDWLSAFKLDVVEIRKRDKSENFYIVFNVVTILTINDVFVSFASLFRSRPALHFTRINRFRVHISSLFFCALNFLNLYLPFFSILISRMECVIRNFVSFRWWRRMCQSGIRCDKDESHLH